jgi:chemotaxis signal transduction protein
MSGGNQDLAAMVAAAQGAEPLVEAHVVATTPAIVLRQEQRWFALDAHVVRRVVPFAGVTRVPGLPLHVIGVALVHGELVGVVDLARLLEIDGAGTISSSRRLLVIERGGVELAILADEVRGVVEIPQLPTGATPLGRFVRGEVDWDSRLIALLDHRALIEVASDEGG